MGKASSTSLAVSKSTKQPSLKGSAISMKEAIFATQQAREKLQSKHDQVVSSMAEADDLMEFDD